LGRFFSGPFYFAEAPTSATNSAPAFSGRGFFLGFARAKKNGLGQVGQARIFLNKIKGRFSAGWTPQALVFK